MSGLVDRRVNILLAQPEVTPVRQAAALLAWVRFVAVPLALLLLWQLSASLGLISLFILPSPAQVWQAFLADAASGKLAAALLISLRRLALGYVAGVLFGLPLGLLLAISPIARKLIAPSFYFIIRVPLLAWIPFLMVIFGIGEALKLIIIAKAALAPVAMNTERAIRGISSAWRELGRLYRLSPGLTLRRILLPAIILPVFTGLRFGLVQAWATLVVVELLASSNGIGFQLTMDRQLFQLDSMLAIMAVIGIIGFALDRGLALAEHYLARRFGGVA
jgi:sulfonate transport system permease protein